MRIILLITIIISDGPKKVPRIAEEGPKKVRIIAEEVLRSSQSGVSSLAILSDDLKVGRVCSLLVGAHLQARLRTVRAQLLLEKMGPYGTLEETFCS